MNTNDLTYLLNKPNAINEKQTMGLEIVLQQFPYFQSVRALHLKGLLNQDSFRYNYELKKTAAHTNDRSILFDFITSSDFVTLQKNNLEEQETFIKNISVIESEIVPFNEAETENSQEINSKTHSEIESITLYEDKIEETITIKENIETLDANTNSLEIGKPLEFNKNEKHSFQEWLQLTKFSPIERENEEENENIEREKLKKIDIIDRFIELNPKIPPIKQSTSTPVNITKSTEEPTHLMTETLAKVYLEQKKYSKAIQAYDILILKYPEKSSFFAIRIKEIKELQQNNN